ncbi:dynein axonemal heavy chain 3 [Prorops nasuta]|uniref:dynein axonemal heavy chain 3 n=1 Tax=Prorops nasuta TaxID=863751 RepID=UPI0034CE2AED
MEENHYYEVQGDIPRLYEAQGIEEHSIEDLKTEIYVNAPELLQDYKWTKAVPYKFSHIHTTPVDRIGSLFTTSANQCRIKCLSKKSESLNLNLFGPDGRLKMPSAECVTIYKEEMERIKAEEVIKQSTSLTENIVNLRELADGSWKEKRMKPKHKERKRTVNREKSKNKKILCLEAEIPLSVDEQLNKLLTIIDREQNSFIRVEDIQRIKYLKNYCISEKDLADYDYNQLEAGKTRIVGRLRNRKDFEQVLETLEPEIIEYYKDSLRSAIIAYILQDADEQKRLRIETVPISYPVINVTAPVPFHQAKIHGEHFIQHNLFITNEILRDIRDLWFSKYKDMRIIDICDLGDLPIPVTDIESRVNNLCEMTSDKIVNEWLADVAEILLEKKNVWGILVVEGRNASTAIIEQYFQCINSLLSLQLRVIVIQTLQDIKEFFVQYSEGNSFDGEYKDYMFIKTPFISVQVQPELGMPVLHCNPNMYEIHKIFSTCFDKILAVANKVPRIEMILFPELNMQKYLFSISRYEDSVMKLINRVLEIVLSHMVGPQKYLKVYEDLMYIFDGSAEETLNDFFAIQPIPLLREFEQRIRSFDELRQQIFLFRCKIPLNMIEIDCTPVNDTLRQILHSLRSKIVKYFTEELTNNNQDLCKIFTNISENISKMPETTQETVELYNYLVESRDTTMFNMRSRILRSGELVLFLFNYEPFTDEDVQLTSRTVTWPREMEVMMDLASTRLNMRKEFLESTLRIKREKFEQKILTIQKAIEQFKKKDPPVLTMDEMETATEEIEELSRGMANTRKEAEEINEEEGLLDIEISPFMLLPILSSTVDTLDKLWHTVLSFHINYEKWFYGPFSVLDSEEVKEETETIWRNLYKLSRALTDNPSARRIAELVRGKVEKFKQFLPVLQAVCTPGFQPRHWQTIEKLIGTSVGPIDTSSLSDMIELGLSAYVESLEEISNAATKEHALLINMKKMKAEWADVKFELLPYRETGVSILTGVDDIQQLLDDHILKAQTMRGSPFVKAFEAEMTAWETKLILMQDIIDQWLLCQSTWMYLEPIFSSEDIMRQMPIESKNFRRMDKIWRAIMIFALENRSVLDATGKPKLLQELQLCNQLLDEIQKGLNDYLEKKRLFFPRFFFLSNDELLEILSETKDPQRVQPHLKKCFEGISRLKFTKDEEIIGMISAEDEYVPMSGKIIPAEAKGMVEKWLCQVEELMVLSLRDIAQQSIIAYFSAEREEWVLSWPGQIAICGSQIHWTSEVCESFDDHSTANYLQKCIRQIDDIVALVRGKLEPMSRLTLNALIVIDVHAKDVVKLLVEGNITNVMEFSWIAQLRYYWFDDTITVSMITTDIRYAFEYLGNTSRLVITPLTDRCYRTLMGALKLNLGGAPEGPAGTGKTETTKDLAKAVAKQCVVFNCSEGLDYKAMGKFFKGLAQSGAWACFDEFNRIELEVLSVIAQQILSIQMAVSMKLQTFVFEGTEIKLNPTCTVFITMNPGYAGRQELPDNLKVLFRTVAMMVPDYAMIGEITLYSYGFVDARNLAEKIVHTYKLCSEQLSSQNHYDYGMRAVKTVLVAAGNLKLKYPMHNESVIILRAIVDVNLPKFLAQDVPLFNGIYSDLFPGIDLPKPDRDELIELLIVNLEKRNLQATPWYIEKIIQIYEMILVRHGLMIVGEPLGGKTQAYQTLADSLGDLAGKRRAVMREYRTIHRVINPKAISLDQLYGSFDPISHEWSDGVLANTFREFAQSLSTERKWIVFDGPVDAVWIENMNTVLDDNKKLCLMSGEIIALSNKMNMMFEPADLEHASPATVSRCGMIYLEPSQLGWIALYESYKKYLKEKLLVDQYDLIIELIDWLMEPVLYFLRHSCKPFLETSDLHRFMCFSKLFTTMLEEEAQFSTVWLQCILIFCLVWGVGPTFPSDSRQLFDVYFRKLLLGQMEENPRPKAFKLTKVQLMPEKLTVYDWVYHKKNNGTWIPWSDTMTQAPLPQVAKVSELIIQTDEMSIQHFFMTRLLGRSIPVLFVGPTGTGKSAIILNYIISLNKDKYIQNIINFSARTNTYLTQEIVMSKLDRRRKGVYGPPMGKKCMLFVDDLNMPQLETYGAQPPIELLRQWINVGYWFDPKDTSMLYLVDMLLICAMVPPGGGSHAITSRMTRHMNIIGIDFFAETTMTKIFSSILQWHFSRGFVPEVSRLDKMVVSATLSIFLQAIKNFLPIPAKSHYTFNLRDFSRVINGILLVPASRMTNPDKLIRLWVHEVYRVFHDRLVDDADREILFKMVKSTCYEELRQPLEKILSSLMKENEKQITSSHIRDLFFGNYIEPDADPKIYDEVTDLDDLQEKMEYYLSEYNMLSKTPMQLVLFRFAIEHISRISRVLLQDNGHAMLVGVGGSGRNTCAKLATSMCEYLIRQIEITRTYGPSEWRDDLKSVLLKIGLEGKPTVFLFGDNQIKSESFVEDISMILNTADVPNLYASDEKAEILEKMTAVARTTAGGKRTEITPMGLYAMFIDRIKSCLHMILTMSPIDKAFRNRLRMFPSLINCCTINWFTLWPEDALEKVAKMSLKDLDIESDIREKCVHLCKQFHTTVTEAAEDYFFTQRRKYYITPTSFLELIKSLYKLYGKKINQITKQQNRYETGLEKLDFAAGQVAVMQEELQSLQPKLLAQSELSDKLMVRIEQDTVIVEGKKEIVAADEALANEAAAAAQAIKDDCESDLAEATPALQAALAALDTLKPADITIVKSMKSPPAGVRLVMEAVCVLKGVKPERVTDPASGNTVDDYWPASQKVLGDMKFLESLRNFDKDNIPPAYMKRIRDKFINDRSFQPDVIRKVSTACEGLCKWIRAMEVYDRVIKVVQPKKAMLAEAEAELAAQLETLNEKRSLLQEVTEKLQALYDEFAECTREKKKLEDQIELCSQKLDRAEKLIGGLGGEKTRWSELAATLGDSLGNVIGDVLLSSGMVAYLGAFTVDYRTNLINRWHASCMEARIPCGERFNLIDILGEPVEIRQWNIYGLPADNFSVENAIIIKNAERWPLMIDPQNQANKWIKNMEKDNKIVVIKLTDPDYVRTVEMALTTGIPVLLENIAEEIDAILEPILIKNVYKQRGMLFLRFGDQVVEYNEDFRFYITTRLRNPHYLPEVVVKVTLLNFMITPQGLKDQLLGIVVAKELPVLEEKKNQIIVEGANNRRILKDIEDKILEVLSTSQGNILEDETAIKILSTSKILSSDIQAKQEIAVKTAIEIDIARGGYVPVSQHGAILFFCITELANVDPMYQYSLPWFIHLYVMAIANSEKSSNLEERMEKLNTYFTASIYRNICRSLFEKDKLIFSLVLCVGLLRAANELEEEHWVFLLTGGVAFSNPYPNPDPSWLSEKSWSEIVRASSLPGLNHLRQKFVDNLSEWKAYYDLYTPQDQPFPAPFHKDEKSIKALLLLRCIRPDKLVNGVQAFIIENMGQFFVESPPFDLQGSYNDSNNVTPLIFILSPGSDPMAGLIKFAEDRGITKASLMTISLGQGQGPIAAEMINRGLKTGEWVVLQNCHLAVSWMKELDRICDEVIIPENTHEKFRIWLTSYPSKDFPVSILQNGVKMTNEPPKGLKNNLLRSYLNDPLSDIKFFNTCSKTVEWRTLLFSLCFFHGVVQERRNFGPLGWNIPYEFNESDLRICILQLQLFLDDYDETPFEALLYLTGECNYGGRVTDDKDRRLLNSLLKNYYNPDVISIPKYRFSPSGIYYLPENTGYYGCLEYIKSLPINQYPEVFGLHENADITKDNQESMQLLDGALLTQTQISGEGAEMDTDIRIYNIAGEILSQMKSEFDIEQTMIKYPVLYMNSMNTVLLQELIRFNVLTKLIKMTLRSVQKAIKGEVLMSPELEEVFNSMAIAKVPKTWDKKSYPSLKPLGSYINDLLARLDFLQNWIDNNAPIIFWISGFFFTQSFLTGALQNYARMHKIPIDHLDFEFEITSHEKRIAQHPPKGVYIRGLFLEGARWNREINALDESKPKVMFDVVPIIWFKPGKKIDFIIKSIYTCPVYKTSARRGILATTGHSSNFVMFILFPSKKEESHWINRGVACLCQLDD